MSPWANALMVGDEDRVKNAIRAQLFHLQGLLSYLEDREALGAKEYSYCQIKLKDAVKHLKQVERLLTSGTDSGSSA